MKSKKKEKDTEPTGNIEFITGDKILEKEKDALYITTGSKACDEILGGGIRTGFVTEAYGEFGSSKSQLAFQLCVNVQLPIESGGAGKKAIFIDTENTFSANRIEQMAKAIKLDDALKNIMLARAVNSKHQIELLDAAEKLIKKDKKIGLLVIDSITSHFRSDYIGRGELAERQQLLNKHLHKIVRLADVYNIAIYMTNQVLTKPDMFFGDPTDAIGGHVLKHAAQIRLYLRKGKKGTRIMRVIDSPHLADTQAPFIIKEEGVRDV